MASLLRIALIAFVFLALLTISPVVLLAEEVNLFGTIKDHNGNVPESGFLAIDLINGQSGGITIGGISYDEAGNWSITADAGIYTLVLRTGWSDGSTWASGYWNGAKLPWEAPWYQLNSGMAGPFNIVVRPGGTVTGIITNPEGNPVDQFVYVELIYQKQTLKNFRFSNCTNENGQYIIRGVPEGTYKLMTEYIFEEDDGGG